MLTPYDTLVCKHYNTTKLKREIERTQIQYPLHDLVTPRGLRVKDTKVVVSEEGQDDIPAFTQPLHMGDGNWVVDVRMMTRPADGSGTTYRSTATLPYRVTSERDLYFQAVRVALSRLDWEKQGGVYATRLGSLPAKVFIRWVVGTLSGRLGLPADVQIRLSVITGFYYYLRFHEGNAPIEQLDQYVSAATAVPQAQVTELRFMLADEFLPFDIETLIKAFANLGGSVRLERIKFADVYTLLMNSWSGIMAREVVGVALEHMPTFLAMCFTAGTDRSYRKAAIARTFESAGRPVEAKAFTDRIQYMIASELIED